MTTTNTVFVIVWKLPYFEARDDLTGARTAFSCAPTLVQGLLFWLFQSAPKASLGTAGGKEAVMVLTFIFLKQRDLCSMFLIR